MTLNSMLAGVNAVCTSASLACLVLGYRAIKRKQIARHERLMIGAFLTSALFMIVFVIRFATFGFAKFQGTGLVHWIYLPIFLSHEPIAVVNVPLAIATLVLGLRRSVAAHREVARFALPIWMFVAATGIALYVLVYVI